jgi:hypothetical protein
MSDAPRRTASAITAWTSFTTGASSAESRSSITCASDWSSSISWTALSSRPRFSISASMSSGEATARRTSRPVAMVMSSSASRFAGSAVATRSSRSARNAIGIVR